MKQYGTKAVKKPILLRPRQVVLRHKTSSKAKIPHVFEHQRGKEVEIVCDVVNPDTVEVSRSSLNLRDGKVI